MHVLKNYDKNNLTTKKNYETKNQINLSRSDCWYCNGF